MVGKRKKTDAETTINKMKADMDIKMKEVLMGVKKKKKKKAISCILLLEFLGPCHAVLLHV